MELVRMDAPDLTYTLIDIELAIDDVYDLVTTHHPISIDDLRTRTSRLVFRDLLTILKAIGYTAPATYVNASFLDSLRVIITRLKKRGCNTTAVCDKDAALFLDSVADAYADDKLNLRKSLVARIICKQYGVLINDVDDATILNLIDLHAEAPTRETINYIADTYISNVYIQWRFGYVYGMYDSN